MRTGNSRGERSARDPAKSIIRIDCTVNELVCIVYRGIIDLRFVVGGHTIITAYVRFNQHTYDEHSSARAQNTGSCLCEGSNDTTTVVELQADHPRRS